MYVCKKCILKNRVYINNQYICLKNNAAQLWRAIFEFSLVQWRIQDFPDEDANPWDWGENLLFGKIFAMTDRGRVPIAS